MLLLDDGLTTCRHSTNPQLQTLENLYEEFERTIIAATRRKQTAGLFSEFRIDIRIVLTNRIVGLKTRSRFSPQKKF